MKLYVRSNDTNEILHTIHLDDDDKRRKEIEASVLEGFDADTVHVTENDGDERVEETAAEPKSLTGDGHPVDDDAVAIPPDGEVEPT